MTASPSQPAGYSGTPLPKKLGIRPGQRLRFVDAPAEFSAALGPLPDGSPSSREMTTRRRGWT